MNSRFPLLFDGAMGTCFARKTRQPSWLADLAVLDQPEEITAIHREYIDAGAQAIKTDTFGLPDLYLQDPAKARLIVQEAMRCARAAVLDRNVEIFADLGPVSDGENPADLYCELIDLFLEQHAGCFLIETLPSLQGIEQAAKYLKSKQPKAVLYVSFACGADGLSRQGIPARVLLEQASNIQEIDAAGLNCHCGPAHMLSIVRDLPKTRLPLLVMPNAGYPEITARAAVYDGTPDYFARMMESMIHAGAAIVGGCCGTEPDHIAALAKRIDQMDSDQIVKEQTEPETEKSVGLREEGILQENARKNRKSILVELDPPANDRISKFVEGAARLHQAGADMLTIADNPIGRPRADSSILACKIKRELGMSVLPHMTCRDRNLNAIRALLLGLSMENVHHVLLVTGDPLPLESRDEVKTVFSFNSRTLAAYVRTLESDGICQPFHTFGALDLNARNFDVQLRLAKEKEACGIEGFLTQPIFSSSAIENLKRARKELNGLIFAGLMPIVSYRNACFLKNEISGMDIPEELAESYRDRSREECETISTAFCTEIAGQVSDWCDGYYLMTPFQRIEMMEQLIAAIRQMNKTAENSGI